MWITKALALFAVLSCAACESLCPLFSTSFFNQTLHHDLTSSDPSAGTGTFRQQYQLNISFFKPGGPILFYQGAEGATIQCVEGFILHDWAEETGAILASLEHRFFGLSQPSGFNASTASAADYAPLTINNTLLDSVNFIRWIKRTVPDAKHSKTIVMGGSYGGTLATMLRIWYPGEFYGALASGPSLSSFGPEETNKKRYNWWNWVSQVYRFESVHASAKIQTAMAYFNKTLSSPAALFRLAKDMRLCAPYPNATQWANLYSVGVLSTYELAAQFNYHYPNLFPIARPLQSIVEQTLKANSTGEILRIPPQVYTNRTPHQCLDWTNEKLGNSGASAGIQLGPWLHIECTAMTGGIADIASGNVFPSRNHAYNYTALCDSLGISPAFAQLPGDEVIDLYHLTREYITAAGRILFTEGGYDPTASVGPPLLPVSGEKDASRTLFMYENAHTEDTMSEIWGPAAQAEGKAVPESIKKVCDHSDAIFII